MKKHILVVLTALAFQSDAFAQAKRPEPAAPITQPGKLGETAKPGQPTKPDKEPAKAARPMPMHSRVDEIDPVAKSFTHATRDGRKVKHIITEKTEIKQGRDNAKFEDIKVGDMVSGSRLKKSEDGLEYEVVKITKFSAKAKGDDKK